MACSRSILKISVLHSHNRHDISSEEAIVIYITDFLPFIKLYEENERCVNEGGVVGMPLLK